MLLRPVNTLCRGPVPDGYPRVSDRDDPELYEQSL